MEVSGIGSPTACATLDGTLATTGGMRSLCLQVGQTSRSAEWYRWHFAHGSPYPEILRGDSKPGADDESMRVAGSFVTAARTPVLPLACWDWVPFVAIVSLHISGARIDRRQRSRIKLHFSPPAGQPRACPEPSWSKDGCRYASH